MRTDIGPVSLLKTDDAASPVSFTKKKVELDGSDVWSGGEITSSSFEVPEIAALLILSQ